MEGKKGLFVLSGDGSGKCSLVWLADIRTERPPTGDAPEIDPAAKADGTKRQSCPCLDLCAV